MAQAKARAGLEVWKFGGASLADVRAFERALELIRAHSGPLAIVVSAMAGVTDLLLDGARQAAKGNAAAGEQAAAEFLRRHRAVISRLASRRQEPRLLEIIEQSAHEYADLTRAVAALKDLPARASDVLIARGERVATALMAAFLDARVRPAAAANALDFVITDGRHGNATPDAAASRPRARRHLLPWVRAGRIPVIPGFTGAAPDGSLTTLGRGGSDLTATLVGRCLGARRVVLWKDVPGILTADPRLVPDARLIPQLHQREAAEVAYYGAKVLHPRALIPIAASPTVLEVRSFLNPQHSGTEISARASLPKYPVKAVATILGQASVTVAGKGMLGVPGIAARTFEAVHKEGLSVSTIFQASSESSIGFTLTEADATRAVTALRRAFRAELDAGLIDSVSQQSGLAVIAVVGNGMSGTPGIAARVFSALAAGSINVVAIAQGSSELNISFVVAAAQAADATRRVHAAFQLAKIGGGRSLGAPHTDLVLLGFGKVGRALADQIAATGQDGSQVRVVGLLDRSGYVFEPRGLSRRRLLQLAEGKDRGALLTSMGGVRADASTALTTIASHAVSRPILTDVTADDTGELLCAALTHGFDLVLANKRPLAGSNDSYARLLQTARSSGRRIRYEATVGAGLPVLDTYLKLIQSGDRILRIEGSVSGTLGYVLSALTAGIPFSQAVVEAVERGYAEPDPRDDLSGRDTARKALILARLLGYQGPAPVPEDLTPAPLRRLPPLQFLKRLPSLDDEWRRRVARAAARGRVWRYVVSATRTSARAELVAVPTGSALGSLSGTRNLLSFTTRRYREEPLIITGPGAGPAVTAAGVLNDIQYLAATDQ